MAKIKEVKLRWSKKEKDWTMSYPDRAGKSLCSLFFDMLKIETNIRWIKEKFINGRFESIPLEQRDTLIKQLTDRGYDYTTFKITCNKLK